jgi:hypothetical protein
MMSILPYPIIVTRSINLCCLLLLFILTAARLPAQSTKGPDNARDLRKNVVKIRAERGDSPEENGYGFIVGERERDLYIVTANHVVRSDVPGASNGNVEVMFFSDQGKWHSAELLERVLSNKDVAVIRVKRPEGLMWKANSLAVEKGPLSGRQVWFIGRPGVDDEWYVTFTPGIVSKGPNTNYELTVETNIVRPGMSGAPVLTETGIAGMIIRDKDAAIAIAIALDPIKEAFDQWQYPWDLNSSNTDSPSRAAAQTPLMNPSRTASPPPSNSSVNLQVQVRADNKANGWTNTGVVVKPGQRVSIKAGGVISLGRGRSTIPDGARGIDDPSKLMRDEPTGGLIAVIGDDNDNFIFIGNKREFVTTRSGILFLGVNEGYLDDNTGSYTAMIGVRPLVGTYKEIEVRADNTTNGWTNTGLIVRSGQRLRVTAFGRIALDPRREFICPPGGFPLLPDKNKLMRGEPTGGLIAVIGDDNDDFIFIGDDREFVATRSGVLFLGVNEGYLNDNSGAFHTIIELQ